MLLLFLLLLGNNVACQQIEGTSVYFSEDDKCMDLIKDLIDNAKISITFAIYELCDKELINSLIEASKRGVEVKGILDKESISRKSNRKAIEKLRNSCEVRIMHKDRGVMHNKIAIIDNETVITGSYNWSFSANNFNNENLIIIRDKNIVCKYIEQLEKLNKDIV